MTKFKNREEYEKWKAEKLKQIQEAKAETEKDAVASVSSMEYASFWKRLAAYLIDIIVMSIATLAAGYILQIGFFILLLPRKINIIALGYEIGQILGIMLISIIPWLYFSVMESSSKQATLGKMALGIIVTDLERSKISRGRAIGRNLAKIISGWVSIAMGVIIAFFIGIPESWIIISGLMLLIFEFLIIGLTVKQQALHDIMADTLVVVKR